MTWATFHQASEQSAGEAERLTREARVAYLSAARREEDALNAVSSSGKLRTICVTLKSTAWLYLKADNHMAAERVVATWVDKGILPDPFVDEMREALKHSAPWP
jgi:hypothetical protein